MPFEGFTAPEGFDGWLEGRPEFPTDGLEPDGAADGLLPPFEGFTAPEGFDGLEADDLDVCPEGLAVCLEAAPFETAGDLREEVFDEDLCTDVERDEPDDERDPPLRD